MIHMCGVAAPWTGPLADVWVWCSQNADHQDDHKVRHDGKVYRWPITRSDDNKGAA